MPFDSGAAGESACPQPAAGAAGQADSASGPAAVAAAACPRPALPRNAEDAARRRKRDRHHRTACRWRDHQPVARAGTEGRGGRAAVSRPGPAQRPLPGGPAAGHGDPAVRACCRRVPARFASPRRASPGGTPRPASRASPPCRISWSRSPPAVPLRARSRRDCLGRRQCPHPARHGTGQRWLPRGAWLVSYGPADRCCGSVRCGGPGDC